MLSATARGDGLITGVIRRNLLVAVLVLAHWAATLLITRALGMQVHNGAIEVLMMLFGTVIPVFLFVLLLWRVVHMLRHVRPARPSAWLIADIRAVVLDRDRLLDGMITLVLLSVFFTNFSLLKLIIPQLNPFGWDTALADLDNTLHGGTDPWALLLPVFGAPWVLAVLNASYVVWLFVLYFIVFLACFTRTNPQARLTFLVAFVLTWALGGNLLATWFASAGPVFYAPLGLGDRFAPLMAHLHAADQIHPLASLAVQDMLWSDFAAGTPQTGISAFPSMHVASSVLMALYAFTYRRWAGIVISLFAGAIMLGSVMLGWHYAVDGYFGAAFAVLCWKAAGWISRRASGAADPVI